MSSAPWSAARATQVSAFFKLAARSPTCWNCAHAIFIATSSEIQVGTVSQRR